MKKKLKKIQFIKRKSSNKSFIAKAKKAGFKIIKVDGVQKIEINLQKPIVLKEDFELPTKFNHLIYYCIAPFESEAINKEMLNCENSQLYDFFEDEKVII